MTKIENRFAFVTFVTFCKNFGVPTFNLLPLISVKTNSAFSILLLLCLLLAIDNSLAAPSGDTKLDIAIQKANSEFLTAVKTGDAATIAAPYAENGLFILPDGTCIKGRAEIEKMYRTGFERSGPPKSTTLDSKNVVLDGDIAYESGSAEIIVEKEGKSVTRTSRYLTVWQRAADGEWKIVRNIVLS